MTWQLNVRIGVPAYDSRNFDRNSLPQGSDVQVRAPIIRRPNVLRPRPRCAPRGPLATRATPAGTTRANASAPRFSRSRLTATRPPPAQRSHRRDDEPAKRCCKLLSNRKPVSRCLLRRCPILEGNLASFMRIPRNCRVHGCCSTMYHDCPQLAGAALLSAGKCSDARRQAIPMGKHTVRVYTVRCNGVKRTA